jgi:hypothetical protein
MQDQEIIKDDISEFEKCVNEIFVAYHDGGFATEIWNEKIAPQFRKIKRLLEEREIIGFKKGIGQHPEGDLIMLGKLLSKKIIKPSKKTDRRL